MTGLFTLMDFRNEHQQPVKFQEVLMLGEQRKERGKKRKNPRVTFILDEIIHNMNKDDW